MFDPPDCAALLPYVPPVPALFVHAGLDPDGFIGCPLLNHVALSLPVAARGGILLFTRPVLPVLGGKGAPSVFPG